MKDGWLWRFARWANPKLLLVSRYLTVGLLGFSLWLWWLDPRAWSSYLPPAFFVGVLYILLYLEQVSSGRPKQ